jgi:hypothetical protein
VKRLGFVLAVFAMAVVFYRPAGGQQSYEERISDLETRGAVLKDGDDKRVDDERAGGHKISGIVRFSGYSGSEVRRIGQTCEGDDGSDPEDVGFGEDVVV